MRLVLAFSFNYIKDTHLSIKRNKNNGKNKNESKLAENWKKNYECLKLSYCLTCPINNLTKNNLNDIKFQCIYLCKA